MECPNQAILLHKVFEKNVDKTKNIVHASAQNTRGRWAIRPRELHNRPHQVAHGGVFAKLKIAPVDPIAIKIDLFLI